MYLNILLGQAPAWDWVTKAGGTGDDAALSTTSDIDGAIIVAGYFSGSITFGTYSLSSFGVFDFFIAKYDSTGNVLWAKSGGGPLSDQISSITTDPWGNILVTGAFQSPTLTIDTLTLLNSGSWDAFAAKFDPQGNIRWAKQIVGPDHDNSNCVIADSNCIVIGGRFKQNIVIGNDTLINVSSGTNAFDIFLVKYDTLGNAIWSKSIGSPKEDVIKSLAFDYDGNILATGTYGNASITFGTTTLSSSGGNDIFLAKFNRLGDVIWAKKAGGIYSEYANALSVDQNNNPIVSGYFSSPKIYFDTDSLINSGVAGSTTFLAKYNSNGNIVWARKAGNATSNVGYASCTDQDNNILIAGNYQNNPLIFGGDTLDNNGAWDIYLLKFDEFGNELWAKSAGGGDNDETHSNCLAITPNGAVLLAGGFYSDSIFFDSISLINTVINDPISNKKDMFLAVLSPSTLTTGIGILETSIDDYVILFPNPTNGTLNLKSAHPIHEIKIFGSTGQQIMIENVNGQQSYAVTLESNGVFFVQIMTDIQITTKKVVVKK